MTIALATSMSVLPARQANAYEIDGHFYFDRILHEIMGIDSEYARLSAGLNNFVDESLTTTAMALAYQRGAEHFPGRPELVKPGKESGHGAARRGFVQWVSDWITGNYLMVAEPDAPISRFDQQVGYRKGNPVAEGKSGHNRMDGDGAHAGFSNGVGHGLEGHDPDRIWRHKEKFDSMVRGRVRDLIAKRVNLEFTTPWAVDIEKMRTILGRDLSGADLYNENVLTDRILNHPQIQAIRNYDPLRDSRYVMAGLKEVFEVGKVNGWVAENIELEKNLLTDEIRAQIDGTRTVKEMVEIIISTGAPGKTNDVEQKSIFNEAAAFRDLANSHDTYSNLFNSLHNRFYGEILKREIPTGDLRTPIQIENDAAKEAAQLAHKQIASDLSHRLVRAVVPSELNDFTKHLFESESRLLTLERKLREESIRKAAVTLGLADVHYNEHRGIISRVKGLVSREPELTDAALVTNPALQSPSEVSLNYRTRVAFRLVVYSKMFNTLPGLHNTAVKNGFAYLTPMGMWAGLQSGKYRPLLGKSYYKNLILNGRKESDPELVRRVQEVEELRKGFDARTTPVHQDQLGTERSDAAVRCKAILVVP
jgi:hypothetical protein